MMTMRTGCTTRFGSHFRATSCNPISTEPSYPEDDPDPDNWFIDIFGVWDLLYKASFPSVSGGIASVDDQYDPKNLKQYVSNVSVNTLDL